MQNVKLQRIIVVAAAIALGSFSSTVDAYARSGVGGAGGGGGHAAPGGGAGGHAIAAPRGTPVGAADHAHATDGAAMMRVGNGFVPN